MVHSWLDNLQPLSVSGVSVDSNSHTHTHNVMYTHTYTLIPGTHTVGESSTMSIPGVRVDSNSHTYTHSRYTHGWTMDGGRKFTHVHTMHAHMLTPHTLIVGEFPIIECT